MSQGIPSLAYSERPQPLAVRFVCLVLLLIPSIVLLLLLTQFEVGRKPLLIGAVASAVIYPLGLCKEFGVFGAATHRLALLHFLLTPVVFYFAKVTQTNESLAAVGGVLAIGLIVALLPKMHALGSLERRARKFIARLSTRTVWPEDVASCEHLPEVKILHDLLARDAEPALVQLSHPRPQVRMVILSALQARSVWRHGQAERVLSAAHFAQEPVVRAAALRALANVKEITLLARIAEFATDADQLVRQATLESLMYNAQGRWTETRRYVHTALNDRRFVDDGPLPVGTQTLPTQALDDISVWACEPSTCNRRSLATLILYYGSALQRDRSFELMQRLYSQMLDNRLHSNLRVELAHLLQQQAALTPDILKRMMEYHQPSQIRLLAAAEALKVSFDELAVDTLREVARQPNREIALSVAQVLQLTMNIDMGLPMYGELPPPNSKHAAEVARRVVLWTQGKWPQPESEMEFGSLSHTPEISERSSTARLPRPNITGNQKRTYITPFE